MSSFFNIIVYSFLIFYTKAEVFPEDEQCEKMGSLLINHIIEKTPLPDNISDSINLLKYSGSGLNDLGDYYACKKLHYANYFTISVSLSGMGQSIGICYFKDCSRDYLQNAAYHLYDYFNSSSSLPITKEQIIVQESESEIENQRKDYNNGFYIVMIVAIFLISITLIGTMTKIKILEPFDVEKNIKTIFNVHNQNNVMAHLRIFDGIRFLSAGWVVFGHTMYVPLIYGAKNSLEIYYQVKEWYFPFITSAYFSVDVFFYLSGFLFNFSMQKYFNKSIPRVKIIIISIVMRYIRLLPFMLVGIFGFIYVFPFLSNSPNMSKYIYTNQGCLTNYWHNLLYINNIMTYDHTGPNNMQCAGHFWYLACDMQFFIASMIIVVFFNNLKLIRHIILALTFLGSCVVQIYLVFKHKYQYNDMVHPNGTTINYFYDFYIQPYSRIIPYIIGIYFSELFLETDLYKNEYLKSDYEKLPKVESSINDSEIQVDTALLYKFNKYIEENDWFAFVLLFIGLLLVNVFFWTSSISNFNELSVLGSALFNTFGKVFFVIGLGIIVHLTFLDKFAFIRNLLTFKIESAVSRSSYGIYAVHFFLVEFYTLSYETYYYNHFYDLAFLSIGIFILSWVLSLAIGLVVESPVIVMSKKLIRSGSKNDKK